MNGVRARRVRTVREGTLIATVDIGITNNTGYCTPLDGRSTKSFRFDNTKEGFEKFWGMTIASKNRFGCDEVLVVDLHDESWLKLRLGFFKIPCLFSITLALHHGKNVCSNGTSNSS
jgi:hypothetical protein